MTRLAPLLLCFCILAAPLEAKPKKSSSRPPPKSSQSSPSPSSPTPSPSPISPQSKKEEVAPAPSEAPEGTVNFLKLNNFIGMEIVQGSALIMGMQLGLAFFDATPFYIGPEVNFALFSGGHILGLLGGAWYESRIHGSPRLSATLGLLGGVDLVQGVGSLASTSLAAFVEAIIAQDLDDLVTVRGQFRPGVVGKYFAFMMNFNVCFRF